MGFDWVGFLRSRNISYEMSGRFNVNVHCPLCGSADHGHHLAISLRGRGWRCLRNSIQHRGRSARRLVTLLTGCSETEAAGLVGDSTPALQASDTFSQTWRRQLGVAEEARYAPARRAVTLPVGAHPLVRGAKITEAFWGYLEGRGFSQSQADWAARTYDFHYAVAGRCAWRVVIPVRLITGELVSWTARAVSRESPIRYLSATTDEPAGGAATPISNLVLGAHMLVKPETDAQCLVICEGPFDAIAVSALGHKHGVWGTCLFGLNISDGQSDVIYELARRFRRLRLALDSAAWARILTIRERLPRACSSVKLPEGLKDPGELMVFPGGADFVRSLR